MKNLKTSLTQSLALFFTGLVIPLGPSPQWHPFQFTSQMPNKVENLKDQLNIVVKGSASPLIYVLKKPRQVKKLTTQFSIQGFPKPLPKNVTQGFRGSDDFILRVGLIYRGDKKMNWLQRQFAPKWLIEMEKLLPQGAGVGRVFFITTCRDPKIHNKLREHFLDSTMVEECATLLPPTDLKDRSAPLSLSKELEDSTEVLGLWITADGDDLGSEFAVQINEIKLHD